MTVRQLQQHADATRRQASRAFIRARVELTRAEVRRETDEEIRAELANVGWMTPAGSSR